MTLSDRIAELLDPRHTRAVVPDASTLRVVDIDGLHHVVHVAVAVEIEALRQANKMLIAGMLMMMARAE